MLRELDAGLWVVDHPFKMPGGIALGTRTTIVGRDDGGLLLISPGPLGDAVCEQIGKLGRVSGIVAPNNMHHLYVPDAVRACPDALLYGVAGVVSKQKQQIFSVLAGTPPDGWQRELDAVAVAGIPMLDELVFLHRPTRSLILTDLCFNVQHSDSLRTRVFLRINSAYGRFGPSRLLRSAIRDKAACRRSLDLILEWDFDRVLLAHGEILESGGHEALRSAYAWLRS